MKYIIKIRDRYFFWSTIADAPLTYGMTEAQLREYTKEEYGNNGLLILEERLKRVGETGCSSAIGHTMREMIACNRAGDNESTLTEDELWEKYAYPPEEG